MSHITQRQLQRLCGWRIKIGREAIAPAKDSAAAGWGMAEAAGAAGLDPVVARRFIPETP
jgi:hypothetical protein